jgi:3-methyladenine DNA glycosylase AlkD
MKAQQTSLENQPKLDDLIKELRGMANPSRAHLLGRYFKCGKGEYGEGDVFLGGIITANQTSLAKKYKELSLIDIKKLIKSKYHEERNVALGILKEHFRKADKKERKEIYNFYLANTKYINNWDLVDMTAPRIVGSFLLENPKEIAILRKLAKSKSLWERRIAIISTFSFIDEGRFEKTFEIAEILLKDKEDLIHKAVGWSLREVGKKNQKLEERFLKKHYGDITRTALRYAIEKFPESLRKQFLLGSFG